MVTAPPLRRPALSASRGGPSLVRSPDSLNQSPRDGPAYWRNACVSDNNRFYAPSKPNVLMKQRLSFVCLAALALSVPAAAEDGYDLWLRYRAVDAATYPALAAGVTEIV